MTSLPPGLDDEHTRRHVLVALGRWRDQLRRDAVPPPAGLAAFEQWVTAQRYTVEDRERALTRERVRRYRERRRASAA